MKGKILGWIYLYYYLADFIFSIIATFVSALEPASNMVSVILALFSVVILIIACVGVVKPRVIFIILSFYYLLLNVFGMGLGIALVVRYGPEVADKKISISYLAEQFSWYMPVHWILIALGILLSFYGIVFYMKHQTDQPLSGTES